MSAKGIVLISQIPPRPPPSSQFIRARGNVSANGKTFVSVFKLQLKVMNKTFCYLYRLWVNQNN